MAVPDPTQVAPWYLRNINQALQLDEATGNVFVRTGITGDVVITGPVTIPGTVTVNSSAADPVHVHLDEVGTSGILAVPYMPIGNTNVAVTGGNLTVNGNVGITSLPPITGNVGILGNVNVTQGTTPWSVTGNTNVAITSGNVGIAGNIAGITALPPITGAVSITGNANVAGNVGILGNVAGITALPPITGNVGIVGNATVSGNVGIIGNVNVTQGTSPWVISGNVQIANAATDLTIADSTYEMNIARGLITGTYSVFKTGYNPSIANNNEESIWGQSVLYPWSAWNTGGTLSCVSGSASDTGTMEITGLRSADWVQITETVTMTGTTPVVTANSFIRINNLHYNGADTNVGTITCSRGATVVGAILAEFGQTQMAQYTIPAGYTAYLINGNANMGKGNDGTGKFKYRPFGGSFQTAVTFLLFQSTFNYEFQVPLVLPEKTDLDVTMLASNSGTACSTQYELILIQNP